MTEMQSPHILEEDHSDQKRIEICQSDFPVQLLTTAETPNRARCLAVVSAIEGPSYRPLGAAMVIAGDGPHWGTLSSGCIEDDVILHAREALKTGQGKRLRYGRGSPYIDLQLPCGGGLEVTLIPSPDPEVVDAALTRLDARSPVHLTLTEDNQLRADADAKGLQLTVHPRPRLVIFGKGPEARALFEMANATDIEALLFSPDIASETAEDRAHPFTGPDWPQNVALDARSAAALFFHDHEKEPPLLAYALNSKAFYVGALGSAAARATREMALETIGVPRDRIDKMVKPFGLVAHARAPHAIAAGVLAQVFEYAKLG